LELQNETTKSNLSAVFVKNLAEKHIHCKAVVTCTRNREKQLKQGSLWTTNWYSAIITHTAQW